MLTHAPAGGTIHMRSNVALQPTALGDMMKRDGRDGDAGLTTHLESRTYSTTKPNQFRVGRILILPSTR